MKYFKDLELNKFEKELYDGKTYKKRKSFKKDHKRYGFDERTTRDLRTTLLLDIYLRLEMYIKCTDIDLTYNYVLDFNKRKVNTGELIENIKQDIKTILDLEDKDCDSTRLSGLRQRMFYNLSVALPHLWW